MPVSIASEDIYTVSRLNREARATLTRQFPLLWIEGELSNFSMPASGHWYFTLKDSESQVRCCMFRNRNAFIRFEPANGAQVLIQARVGLYEPRGEFQLTVEHMEPAGAGALQRAFEALKQKLAAEGLFDPARKRSLPAFPRMLGIITSPTGAALRDIVSVLSRRFRPLPLRIYPTSVQGESAAREIVRAIRLANRDSACDVLILARGGGSLEDLWPFNEEIVARAILASEIPIVSGVGHETDFTIADFVADLRAPTPSAAAELCSPDGEQLLEWLHQVQQNLVQIMNRKRHDLRQRLEWLSTRLSLRHPRLRLQRDSQRLDELEARARFAIARSLGHAHLKLAHLLSRTERVAPRGRLAAYALQTALLKERVLSSLRTRIRAEQSRLTSTLRALGAISPQATLDRGYALVFLARDNALLRDSAKTEPGDEIEIRLARGGLGAKVLKVDKVP